PRALGRSRRRARGRGLRRPRQRRGRRGGGVMRARLALLFALALVTAACDENREKELVGKVADSGKAAASASAVAGTPPPPADAAPARKSFRCGAGPDVDFHGNTALEAEVRKKLGKDAGTVMQSELKTIKSLNLTQATIDDLDPCIFPLFTGLKDLF